MLFLLCGLCSKGVVSHRDTPDVWKCWYCGMRLHCIAFSSCYLPFSFMFSNSLLEYRFVHENGCGADMFGDVSINALFKHRCESEIGGLICSFICVLTSLSTSFLTCLMTYTLTCFRQLNRQLYAHMIWHFYWQCSLTCLDTLLLMLYDNLIDIVVGIFLDICIDVWADVPIDMFFDTRSCVAGKAERREDWKGGRLRPIETVHLVLRKSAWQSVPVSLQQSRLVRVTRLKNLRKYNKNQEHVGKT